jgi:hypothetical protein
MLRKQFHTLFDVRVNRISGEGKLNYRLPHYCETNQRLKDDIKVKGDYSSRETFGQQVAVSGRFALSSRSSRKSKQADFKPLLEHKVR